MNAADFKKRTKEFALQVVRLVESLPSSGTSAVLGKQLLRSGTSVGANYRAACRAKSRADFVFKMNIVEEECDEALYWLELLVAAQQASEKRIANLYREGTEILALTVASARTARAGASSASRSPNKSRNEIGNALVPNPKSEISQSEIPKSAIRNPQSNHV